MKVLITGLLLLAPASALAHDVYVSNEKDNTITIFDCNSFEIKKTLAVGKRPRFAQFTDDNSKLWVSAEIGGTVHIVDVATKQQIHEIKFKIRDVSRDKIQPVGIKLSADGKYAFVALGPANHVAVVDAKTYDVLKYVLVGRRVWQLAFSPEEDKLFTTNGVSGDVTVIDVAALAAIKSVKVGRYPWGVAVLPDGK